MYFVDEYSQFHSTWNRTHVRYKVKKKLPKAKIRNKYRWRSVTLHSHLPWKHAVKLLLPIKTLSGVSKLFAKRARFA